MNPPPDLDHLAGLYRWMEAATFGPWLGWCRTEYLQEMRCCRRALVLGDGDGRFTARLLEENREIEIDAIDASPAMLAALLRRAGKHAGRIRTHCADVRTWQPPHPPYDLVVSHFLLDFLTESEVRELAETVRRSVSPGAHWVVSEFAIPQNPYGAWVAKPVVAALYLGFHWLTGLSVNTLPDHRSALRAAGFTRKRHKTRLAGLLISEFWNAD